MWHPTPHVPACLGQSIMLWVVQDYVKECHPVTDSFLGKGPSANVNVRHAAVGRSGLPTHAFRRVSDIAVRVYCATLLRIEQITIALHLSESVPSNPRFASDRLGYDFQQTLAHSGTLGPILCQRSHRSPRPPCQSLPSTKVNLFINPGPTAHRRL
jgi:hypothetical protein